MRCLSVLKLTCQLLPARQLVQLHPYYQDYLGDPRIKQNKVSYPSVSFVAHLRWESSFLTAGDVLDAVNQALNKYVNNGTGF